MLVILRRSVRTPATFALVVGALAATAVGCGSNEDGSRRTITVFAAAALTDAFTELGEDFEAANPGTDVVFSFAASSELVTQIGQGAPADVFASADEANMAAIVEAGGSVGDPVVFATNSMAVLVGAGNPLGIDGLDDLADPELVVVVCAPQAPCGRYSQQVLDAAGVTVTPSSFEENVKAVVSKVVLGEADAGIVYATDVVAAADSAAGVEIPETANVTARFPITVTAQAPNPDGATAFIDYVLSPAGRKVLQSQGFGVP